MSRKIRLGNDIDITWSLLDKDEQPYIVEGRDFAVEIHIGKKRFKISNTEASGNSIHFIYYGKDQKVTGPATLVYIENGGRVDMVTFDTKDVFTMVEHSWLAVDSDEQPETVTLDVVTVLSNLESSIGPRGYSAYEIAVQNGYHGTEEEWLASLKPHITADADGNVYCDGVLLTDVIYSVVSEVTVGEQGRQEAESNRVAAETARETAEAARVAAEALRVTAEGSRETAEAAREAQASADHTVATGDHTQAAADHTQAAADHTTAASDHTQAGADHTRAAADHVTAGEDHAQAQDDHEVMEGYDTRLGSVESEVSQLEAEINGINVTYTKNADGNSVTLSPAIESGSIILSLVGGPTSVLLYDENNATTSVYVSSLPYTAPKKYVKWSVYKSGSPSTTMTVKSGRGLIEDISDLGTRVQTLEGDVASLQTIRTTVEADTKTLNGETNTHTRNADGQTANLSPTIKAGDIITGFDGDVANIVLYDASSQSTTVPVNSLPYTATKEFTKWAIWKAGTPECTMTVLSPGVVNNVDDLESRVEALENESAKTEAVTVHLPSKVYAVVGDTIQLFYRSIIGAIDPYSYDIVPNCSKGNHFPRYWKFTPQVTDLGTHTLTITVKDRKGNTLGTGQTSIVVVAAPTSPVSLKNIFCFGDSLTQGVWSAEAKRRLVLTNTVDGIEGDGLSNIAFCGSMQKTISGTVINYFGVGGWTWQSYITEGAPAFRFQVSGVTSLSLNATYTNNGHTYTIKEINVTGGTGNILCETSDATNTPTASGTLTKASGNGDATIAFSSADAGNRNPLWDVDNDKMSFIPYVDDAGNGQIDAVCVLLSWNDQSSWKEYSVDDVSGHIANAKVFLDTLHDEYPSAKCFIMGIQMPSINGGLGANYGASGGYIDRYGLFETVFSYNEALEALCLSNDYSSFCEYVPVCPEFDSEYNMQAEATKVNTRNNTTEMLGTNGVHPGTQGQYQIADAVYRSIVANFCQS